MNTVIKIILATAFCMLTTIASADPTASTPDISGTYKCKWHDPNSTPSDGTETIVYKKVGDAFSGKIIEGSDTKPYFYATAFFNKDVTDSFSDVYWNVKDPTSFASEIFVIQSDGSLDGVFLTNNGTKPGSETCVKSS